MSLKIKPLDFVVFAAIAAAAVISFLLFFSTDGGTAVVSVNGVNVANIDLATASDGEVALGIELAENNVIMIKNHKIGVASADCADRVCVHRGFIGRGGEVVVCVPSRLVIEISGSASIDAVTGDSLLFGGDRRE